MEKDKRVSCINFTNTTKSKLKPSSLEGYGEREEDTLWFLNCQAALWRRKDLISFLNPHENPWQYEVQGSERVKLFGKRFLKTHEYHAFRYSLVPEEGGHGVYDGKWLKSNVELFENEGLSVDFDKLGFYEETQAARKIPPVKINFKWKTLYFLYGGYEEKKRMPILSQLKMLVLHPKHFMRALKRKIGFLRRKEI